MPASQGQKIFFVSALIVVVLSTVVLSLRRFYHQLKIARPGPVLSQAPTVDQNAQTKDTDGDGISDTDELFRYGTSPYLKDSDSDGIPDGVETKNGTNPNCPEGKTCQPQDGLFGKTATPSTPLIPSAVLPIAPSTPAAPEQLLKLLSGGASVKELRDFLQQQGARPEDLAAIDDATLQNLYAQSLKQQQADVQSEASVQTQPLKP